jgi:hypothetical protein
MVEILLISIILNQIILKNQVGTSKNLHPMIPNDLIFELMIKPDFQALRMKFMS